MPLIVLNFTRLTAREITYKNFEISLEVFMPNITTIHAITYTNPTRELIRVTTMTTDSRKQAKQKP